MRIGLDARYANDHFPGIGRSIVGLVRALSELEHGHQLVLIIDPRRAGGRYDLGALARLPGLEIVPLTASPFGLKQHVALPALARRHRLDLLHSPYFIKPYIGLPCPSVVTIYDLIGWHFPHQLSWRGRMFYRMSMGLAVRTSSAVITISESARADLAHIYGLSAERLDVTPLAADRRFSPRPAPEVQATRARYRLPANYILYMGSNKPHKNLERLVRAWEYVLAAEASQGAILVLAGHQASKRSELRRFVDERGLSRVVRFLPNLADADLPALYSGAMVFAFPSIYEGFGLPPLEAMACGAPVLCANSSSLPEVVGAAALTVDPFHIRDIAQGLTRLLTNPALRRELSARGQRRAREYSWRRTALGTLRVYERVLGSGQTYTARA